MKAAMDGKKTMMVYNLANDDEPEDLVAVRLTERIDELTGHKGAIFLIDEPAEKPEKKQEKKPVVYKGEPTRGVDSGKIRALTNAGWSAAKIADEMGISVQTVYNYQKKEKQ